MTKVIAKFIINGGFGEEEFAVVGGAVEKVIVKPCFAIFDERVHGNYIDLNNFKCMSNKNEPRKMPHKYENNFNTIIFSSNNI